MKYYKTVAKSVLLAGILLLNACHQNENFFEEVSQKQVVNDEVRSISALGYSSTSEMLENGWAKLENKNKENSLTSTNNQRNARIREKLTFDHLAGLGFNQHRLKNLITDNFNSSPDGISVNSEGRFNAVNPTITDQYSRFAYIESGNPSVTVTTQSEEEKVVYDYTLYNYSDQTDTHTLVRSHQSGTTSSWSVSSSVNVTVGGKVGIPLISEGSVEVSVGTTAGGGGSESHVVTNEIQSTVSVPPHSKRRVVLIERIKDAKYEYEIPVYTSGWIGSNFGHKVNGHYYWFSPINNLIGPDGREKELGEVIYNKVFGGEMFAYEAQPL